MAHKDHDCLLTWMQRSGFAEAMRAAFNASPAEMGAAAVKAAKEEALPRLLSVLVVAKKLGISDSLVRLHIRKKQIKSVRVGRRVLVPREELERLVAEGV